MRLQVLEVLEDLGGIEDFQIAVNKDWHLPLGIDAKNIGMLRLIQPLHLERHHHKLEIQTLFRGSDLGFRSQTC